MTSRADLLLVRHAETPWNTTGRLNSRTDVSLSERGRSQATELASALERLPIGHVACSPALRARETIGSLTRAPVTFDEKLLEVDFGRFEGLTRMEAAQDPLFTVWEEGGHVPESVAEATPKAVHRITAACEDASTRPGPIVAVVAHGMLIRLFLAQAVLGMPLGAFRSLRTDNATCVYLVAASQAPRWRLAGLGMPPRSLPDFWEGVGGLADDARQDRG